MQGTAKSCSLPPFPRLPAVAKHEPMGDLERLEELIGLEERRAEQGIGDAKRYQIAEDIDRLHWPTASLSPAVLAIEGWPPVEPLISLKYVPCTPDGGTL